jgi:glycosyltransferase involved in cell wall biosynthesis
MVPLAHYLRLWDTGTAARIDRFVANSANVAQRIQRYYGCSADVVFPPVETQAFTPCGEDDGFYLVAGQLVGYKRVDLAVEAFNRMGRRLVIIGAGDQQALLARRAGPTVELIGAQPAAVLGEHYRRCRALIFPGEEDFGIVPVEAMASGKPVIAYGRGGALETVVDGRTGLFFAEQTVESLIDAVERFEVSRAAFSAELIAAHARQFDASVFRRRMLGAIDRVLAEARRPAA